MAADARQLDIDYSNTINNLKAKLKRQKSAVEQTENEIKGFEQLQEIQKRKS